MKQSTTPDPYDAIAAWYDLEHADVADDIEMYRDFAAGTGGPILELGCGSGRVLIPLAEAGHQVIGVDASATMLARCQAAAHDAGVAERVTLVQGDMADLHLPERGMKLAIVALGTFNHLATLADRRAALAAIRAHMAPGALLVVDVAQADARRFAQAAESGQIIHIGTWRDDATGTILTHTAAAQLGSDPGTLTLTHWYDAHTQGGALTRTCIETTLAQITQGEMALLLAATGWRLRACYGDHALDPWDDLSPRLIVTAQAAEQ
jgi:SAM-dependent methyltransferase